jgi:hypothetical protein
MSNLKVAFNSNMVAIRTGEFVEKSINTEKGEFILDASTNMAIATLKEIAAANNVDVSGIKGREAITAAILAHVETLKLPTMDTPPQDEVVRESVKAGVAAEKSDDDLLIEIVQAGIKFSQAQRFLKQAKEDLGLVVSAKDRREAVAEALGKDFAPKTAEEVLEVIPSLLTKIEDLTEAQAKAQIRAYLKRVDRPMPELPKKAKAAGGTGAASGMRGKIFSFLTANPSATKEEFNAFLVANKPDRADKLLARFLPFLSVVNAVATAK